jgi:hypothetical protein
MWKIIDWMGNRLFDNKTFDTFDEGWEFITQNVEEEFEEDNTYNDYYVVLV